MQENSKIIPFTRTMSTPPNHKIFVIIPAYNEVTTIRLVVEALVHKNYNIVVVDDGSNKNLQPSLASLPVYFLRHAINLGQGAALQTGIDFAVNKGADFLVNFDGDGQHQPADIERLVELMVATKADIILGSRFLPQASHNMPFSRKIILQTARFFNFIITGLFLTDAHNGLRIMNRHAATLITITENRMAHATQILSEIKKHQLKYEEAPVSILYTDYSRAKGQSAWNAFRILFDILLNKIFR